MEDVRQPAPLATPPPGEGQTELSEMTDYELDFRGAFAVSSETEFSAVSHKILSRKSLDSSDEAKFTIEAKAPEQKKTIPIKEASQEESPSRRLSVAAQSVTPAAFDEHTPRQLDFAPSESATDLETVYRGMFKGIAIDPSYVTGSTVTVRSSYESAAVKAVVVSPPVEEENQEEEPNLGDKNQDQKQVEEFQLPKEEEPKPIDNTLEQAADSEKESEKAQEKSQHQEQQDYEDGGFDDPSEKASSPGPAEPPKDEDIPMNSEQDPELKQEEKEKSEAQIEEGEKSIQKQETQYVEQDSLEGNNQLDLMADKQQEPVDMREEKFEVEDGKKQEQQEEEDSPQIKDQKSEKEKQQPKEEEEEVDDYEDQYLDQDAEEQKVEEPRAKTPQQLEEEKYEGAKPEQESVGQLPRKEVDLQDSLDDKLEENELIEKETEIQKEEKELEKESYEEEEPDAPAEKAREEVEEEEKAEKEEAAKSEVEEEDYGQEDFEEGASPQKEDESMEADSLAQKEEKDPQNYEPVPTLESKEEEQKSEEEGPYEEQVDQPEEKQESVKAVEQVEKKEQVLEKQQYEQEEEDYEEDVEDVQEPKPETPQPERQEVMAEEREKKKESATKIKLEQEEPKPVEKVTQEKEEKIQEKVPPPKQEEKEREGREISSPYEDPSAKVSASNILRLRDQEGPKQQESTISPNKEEFQDNFVAILADELIEERHGPRDLHKVAEPFVSPPSGRVAARKLSSSSGSSINSDKNAPSGGAVQSYELRQPIKKAPLPPQQRILMKQKSEEESEMTLRQLQPRYPQKQGATRSQHMAARPPPPVQVKSRRAKTKFMRKASPFEDKMTPTPRDQPSSVPQRAVGPQKLRSPISHGVYYPSPLQVSAPSKNRAKKIVSEFNKTMSGFRNLGQFQRIQKTYLNPLTRKERLDYGGTETGLPQVFSKGTELKNHLINADRTFQFISQFDRSFTQDVEQLNSPEMATTFTANDPKWQRVMSYIRKNPQMLMQLIPSPVSGDEKGPRGGGSFAYYKREKPVQQNQWITPTKRGKESPSSDELRLPHVWDPPASHRNIMVQNETDRPEQRALSQQSELPPVQAPPPIESFRANYERLYQDTTSSMENASKQAVRQTDWAETPLFDNFRHGRVVFNAEKDLSFYNEMDIEYILEMLKEKYRDFKKSELLKPFFKKASTTLKKVMEEMSMGQQFQSVQMKHAEIKIENTLRYLIRARLLLQARNKLIEIFALIQKREVGWFELQELSRAMREAVAGVGNLDIRESADWPQVEKLNRNLKHVTAMAMKLITQFQGEFKQFKGNFVFREQDYFKVMRDDVVDIQSLLKKTLQ